MSEAARAEVATLGYERCERLLASADFAWFVAEAITKPRVAAERMLRDLRTDKDVREIAAHVREALEGVEMFVAQQRDVYGRQNGKWKMGDGR